MKVIKKYKKTAVAALLAIIMALSTFPLASAGQVSFPLRNMENRLVADINTQFITTFEQDPVSKMITASVTIKNNSTGPSAEALVISVLGFAVFFDRTQVAPYSYNPANTSDPHTYDVSRMYLNAAPSRDISETAKYIYVPSVDKVDYFNVLGTTLISNNAQYGGFIGGKLVGQQNTSGDQDLNKVVVQPGGEKFIMQLFFMPTSVTNGNLDMSMFSYDFILYDFVVEVNAWIANGSYYVYASNKPIQTQNYGTVYVISPATYKMHFKQPAPTSVTANTTTRTVVGYNSSTMEWSYDGVTYVTATLPVVKEEAHSIFVRLREGSYTGSNGDYTNYKKNLASDPVELIFPASFYSCKDDVTLTKTSTITYASVNDGKVRVGDRVEYLITAKNNGHASSSWTGTVFTDVMPAGTTFNGNVRLNGLLLSSSQYTFANNTLTIQIGDIPGGGTTRTVSFEVVINQSAYGLRIVNSAEVKGKDGNRDDLNKEANDSDGLGGGGLLIVDKSANPTINTVTEGDDYITGKGTPGATVIVDPGDGGQPITVTVNSNGDWEADVSTRKPVVGRRITARQEETDKDPSDTVETFAVARPDPVKISSKTAENITRPGDTKRRVGDILMYTITLKNDGPAKSLWKGAVINDTILGELNFREGTVKIDGMLAGNAAIYNARLLTVNVGDIGSGETKVVTFEVEINNTAYGKTIKNVALVDEKPIEEPDTDPVYGQTAQPGVDTINEGDKVITGVGIEGADIVVTFPNSTRTATTQVSGGVWSVDVPSAVYLEKDDVVQVTQKKDPDSVSDPVLKVVLGKEEPVPSVTKTSENITSTDGITRIGDDIKYTIVMRNIGSPKSYWTGAVMTDVIPEELAIDLDSVQLDNVNVPYPGYNAGNRTLRIPIADGTFSAYASGIKGGTFATVTFICKVKPGTHGKTVKNSVSVTGYSNGDTTKKVDVTVPEDGDGFLITSQSDEPTINDVYKGDMVITGTGVLGATVTVTLPDNSKHQSPQIGPDLVWTVTLPAGKYLNIGDVVKATQLESGKGDSNEVSTIVKDRVTRSVHGYVNPLVTVDLGSGDPRLVGSKELFNIVVELRDTFRTAAKTELTTIATLASDGRGEFTIENVPFGKYVLVIRRPGFMIRCMDIVVAQTDPDTLELAPPNDKNDNGSFNLFPGDCNGDMIVDNEDFALIQSYLENLVDAYKSNFTPFCDLNNDGLIDNEDMGLVLQYWGRDMRWYAGAETVKYGE